MCVGGGEGGVGLASRISHPQTKVSHLSNQRSNCMLNPHKTAQLISFHPRCLYLWELFLQHTSYYIVFLINIIIFMYKLQCVLYGHVWVFWCLSVLVLDVHILTWRVCLIFCLFIQSMPVWCLTRCLEHRLPECFRTRTLSCLDLRVSIRQMMKSQSCWRSLEKSRPAVVVQRVRKT